MEGLEEQHRTSLEMDTAFKSAFASATEKFAGRRVSDPLFYTDLKGHGNVEILTTTSFYGLESLCGSFRYGSLRLRPQRMQV